MIELIKEPLKVIFTEKEFEYLKYMAQDVLKFWKEANDIFPIENDGLFEDKTPVEILNNKEFLDKLKIVGLLSDE